MKKPISVLFVCRANRNRSPTAARVFTDLVREWGRKPFDSMTCATGYDVHVASAGYDADDEGNPLDQAMLDAATYVFALDQAVADELRRRRYRIKAAKFLILDVPDRYHCGFPDLVELLRSQLAPYRRLVK